MCYVFIVENMAKLVNRMFGMENDTSYGDSFLVKSVWRLSTVFMEKTWQIKLPDNFRINFIIKSS